MKTQKKNTKIWNGFPGGSSGKESACNAGDASSILGSGRSPGEGNGNSLQYCCLEKPMDRGAWRAIVNAWGHQKKKKKKKTWQQLKNNKNMKYFPFFHLVLVAYMLAPFSHQTSITKVKNSQIDIREWTRHGGPFWAAETCVTPWIFFSNLF